MPLCHAAACTTEITAEYIFCKPHYYLLSKRARELLKLNHYPGTTDDIHLTDNYCLAVMRAIREIERRVPATWHQLTTALQIYTERMVVQ